MHVIKIDKIQQFHEIRNDWESVYKVDPDANIFLSWSWLTGLLEATSDRWLILAVKVDSKSNYVAFFPLAIRSIQKYGWAEKTELLLAGEPFSYNGGFICLPGHLDAVIERMAHYLIQEMTWDRFSMQNISDEKFASLLKLFPRSDFHTNSILKTSCPYIPLPNNWQQYLQNRLGSTTRRELMKKTRQIEGLSDFRITEVNSENLAPQIESLLAIWQQTWGARSPRVLSLYRSVLTSCFEADSLWLNIMWDGKTPIAGLAGFKDHWKKNFSCYLAGFNREYAKLSPGKVMIGYSIRSAIEMGFRFYNFQKGDEPHKFSFGAFEHLILSTVVTRKIKETATDLIRKRLDQSIGPEIIISDN